MGKLDRLLGLAAKALDLDDGRKRGDHSGTRPASPFTSSRPEHPATAPRPASHDPYAPPPAPGVAGGSHAGRSGGGTVSDADRAAIARYDYLLQTADPHRVEQLHREAFARLTPAQRAQVQERMNAELAPAERPRSSSADDLARAAGRTEAARPGRMRGILTRVRGMGAAGALGGAAVGALGVVAVGAVGSAVAAPLLEQAAGFGIDFDAIAQGIDIEALAADGLAGATEGFDGVADGLGGAAEGLTGAADGLFGSAGDAVSGLGDTVGEWGQRFGDFFGR